MAIYNVVSVRRTPNVSTAATYTELGPVYTTDFTIEDFMSAVPSLGTFVTNLSTLDEDTKSGLRDLVAQPLEIWVYRDGIRIFAGPIMGCTITGNEISIGCRDKLSYLSYMAVTTDKTFSATDMFTIGKSFIDDWQALDYGNFGIDTSVIGTMGATRTFSYGGLNEPARVSDVLGDFASDIFHYWMDPTSDEIVFATSRGSDLSSSVIIERGLSATNTIFGVSPGLVASEIFAVGNGDSGVLRSSPTDITIRASFNRVADIVSFDPVNDQFHIDDLADEYLAERGIQFFQPAELVEVNEARFEDLTPGNIVEYSFDTGLAKQTFVVRISKRMLTVNKNGQDKLNLEFQ